MPPVPFAIVCGMIILGCEDWVRVGGVLFRGEWRSIFGAASHSNTNEDERGHDVLRRGQIKIVECKEID
jgi:hypothetical protein